MERDDVIPSTINRAVSQLDVISAEFITIIRHRSLRGEAEWQWGGLTWLSLLTAHICSTCYVSLASIY